MKINEYTLVEDTVDTLSDIPTDMDEYFRGLVGYWFDCDPKTVRPLRKYDNGMLYMVPYGSHNNLDRYGQRFLQANNIPPEDPRFAESLEDSLNIFLSQNVNSRNYDDIKAKLKMDAKQSPPLLYITLTIEDNPTPTIH